MTNFYENALGLQVLMDGASDISIDKSVISEVGLRDINLQRDPTGIRVAHASEAYFLNDGLTIESEVTPVQKFGEILIKGRAPRVDCVDILGRSVIALPFFDAVVLGPRQEIETDLLDFELEDCDTVLPLDTRLQRPLYIPVVSMISTMFAA